MTMQLIDHCSICGKSSEETYLGRCYFCDTQICGNCTYWLPARQDTIHGVYHTVNRVCADCKPNR